MDTVEPRLLGLDFGGRRIGVAVSDELGLTAQPVLTLVRKNSKQDLKSLGRLLRKFGCSAIVLGNPLHMSGDVSPQATKTHAFAETLRAAFGLPVHLWDERLTSAEAHRHLHASGRPALRPSRGRRSGGCRVDSAELPRCASLPGSIV